MSRIWAGQKNYFFFKSLPFIELLAKLKQKEMLLEWGVFQILLPCGPIQIWLTLMYYEHLFVLHFCNPAKKATTYRRGGVLALLRTGWVWDIHSWIMSSEETYGATHGQKGHKPSSSPMYYSLWSPVWKAYTLWWIHHSTPTNWFTGRSSVIIWTDQ